MNFTPIELRYSEAREEAVRKQVELASADAVGKAEARIVIWLAQEGYLVRVKEVIERMTRGDHKA